MLFSFTLQNPFFPVSATFLSILEGVSSPCPPELCFHTAVDIRKLVRQDTFSISLVWSWEDLRICFEVFLAEM